ncbi:hypothetical protein X975_27111, partial [Stegodyphus mimosarum]
MRNNTTQTHNFILSVLSMTSGKKNQPAQLPPSVLSHPALYIVCTSQRSMRRGLA